MTTLRYKIKKAKILIIFINISIASFILESAYHQLMLYQHGYTPLEELPIVQGFVKNADFCRKNKSSAIGTIEIETHNKNQLVQSVPCRPSFMPLEIINGIPIQVINEKWKFPSFRSESIVKITANNTIILDHSQSRKINNKFNDYSVINYILWILISIIIHYFVYRKIKMELIQQNKLVNKEKNKILSSLKENKKLLGTEIIETKIKFGFGQFGITKFQIDVYYKNNDGTYWHIHSNRLNRRTAQIPESVRKVRWP